MAVKWKLKRIPHTGKNYINVMKIGLASLMLVQLFESILMNMICTKILKHSTQLLTKFATSSKHIVKSINVKFNILKESHSTRFWSE
ncbi:Uncharacterised protein [Mycobacteroides abscessus subsp. abscessus]|nr:Uncharacterised protein [Mycobacteroides abscessus subsp. abscessus]